ncbi:glycosyltransferase [Devosia sp. XJ19-1]|uniref:Glycosyltransferase n=1 Tax=Devosia ureilytica TaxID=2952754 RepID=A0A9Q4FQ59_9HYPH|nr:glycosyltransferase [Devosia ureilytica]MCP8882612.1 glycosyltransferase [Devosia ureilytica]MCP8885501.1 glycosyltransferase [Devosia ureilytica]
MGKRFAESGRMRLLFAIKSLSTLGGGAERVFVDVVNGLHRRGHDVAVMTFEPLDAPSFYRLDEDIRRLEIGARSGSKLGQLALLPAARRTITAFAPDVAVAFMPSSYVPLAAALAMTGVPLIASEHNVPERYRRLPVRWLSMLVSSALVRQFTAVSIQMQEVYPAIVRTKMTVLPNLVTIDPGRRADVVGKGKEEGLIICVGRLHPQKDHLTLIQAFGLLADDFPGWRIRILGDGSERERLEAEIARLGLQSRITLAGTVQDIGAEYSAAQLYVIPSRYESFGLATVEALAHGLPAVGFADCPGTNELIAHGLNGILVTPDGGRVESLAQSLRKLISDPDYRRQLASGADQSKAPSPSVILDDWETMLGSVSGERSA